MKTLKLAAFLMSSLLLVKCTPQLNVTTDYDRDADFSQYTTYYWADEFQRDNGNQQGNESEPLFYNTLNKKRLKEAIAREMEARGYTLSRENPDLLVNTQVVVQERGANQMYYPYYYGFFPYGPYQTTSTTSKEGDVVVELIDQRKRQLVWQGYAPAVLSTNTQDRKEQISDAVTVIFGEYGGRAGQQRQARE